MARSRLSPSRPSAAVTAPEAAIEMRVVFVTRESKVMAAVPESKFKAVAPVLLPRVRVLALAPVPRLTLPVVPESRVRAPVAAELIME